MACANEERNLRAIAVPFCGPPVVFCLYSPVICTTISLFLDLLSKSARTTCCHVPSRSLPFSKGMVREGPVKEARTWLKPLASPHVSSW